MFETVLDLIGGMVTLEAIGISFVVLAVVYFLKWVKLVKTGDVARLTTALISAFYVEADPELARTMIPVVAGLAAAGHELIELLAKKWVEFGNKA